MIINLMNTKPRVEIAKEFNAQPESVFDAWLETGMLSQWMFGPDVRDEKISKLENNPVMGGHFSYLVERDGQQLNHMGTYREIERPNRLVFTWGMDEEAGDTSAVTVEFEAIKNGNRLTLVHELAPEWGGIC